MSKEQKKKPPKIGFRRRKNPYYSGMTKKQIAKDVAKTAGRWLIFTVLAYIYWLVMLLLFSIMLLNVWKVSMVEILVYSAILCGISALVYGYMQVHKKLFY